MEKPLFSCVIPVKGSRPYVEEALASLTAQKMGNELEVIVQDGDIEPDYGQSDALNKGFAKARGEWFFWLNADDVLLPDALLKVKGEIFNAETQRSREAEVKGEGREVELNWIAGNQLLVDDKGKVLKCSVGNGWHDWLYRHAVPHVYGPSSFFRRRLFERVGGINTALTYCMDWDLWIRFMKAGARFERIDEYLWAQRQWSGSKTQRPLSTDEMFVQMAEIERMLDKNGLKVTRRGMWGNRLWRLANGNYVRECFDTFRMRGRCLG